jgi:hypothetical protein
MIAVIIADVITVALWCCCKAAGRADRQEEKHHAE